MLHSLPNCLSVHGESLHMHGVRLTELCEVYGSPLYVFSKPQLQENIRLLRALSVEGEPPIALHYAFKANANKAVLQVIQEAGLDAEVNSSGELWKALQVGFPGERIVCHGVAKSAADIKRALQARCALVVDSLVELSRTVGLAQELGVKPRILLRLAIDVEHASEHCFDRYSSRSKFGMELVDAEQALEVLVSGGVSDYIGLQVHLGGQLVDDKLCAAVQGLLGFIDRWGAAHDRPGWSPSVINLGGGLPINFLHLPFTAEHLTEQARRVLASTVDIAGLRRAVEPLRRRGIPIALEPGRCIVASAAVLLTRVENVKRRSTGDAWLAVDAGFNVLADSFCYKWLFELVAVERAVEPHAFPYRVGGPLCDSADVYQRDPDDEESYLPLLRGLPAQIELGELLAFLDVGAYCLPQATEYNGRLIPAAVMLDGDGSHRLVRRGQGFEDLFLYDC